MKRYAALHFFTIPLALAFVLAIVFLPATSSGTPRETGAKKTQNQRLLDVADVLSARELNGDPAFHPFEELVALAVWRRSDAPPKRSTSHYLDNIDERGVSYYHDAARVVIVDLSSGSFRTIGSEPARSWSPVWSPDGSMLAYLSDAGGVTTIHTWNRNTEQEDRLALPAVPIGSSGNLEPVWLSDSKRMIVAVRGSSLPTERGTNSYDDLYSDGRKVFTSPGSEGVDGNAAGWKLKSRADLIQDLIQLSLEGHETRWLTKGLSIVGFWISPDNKYVAIEETLGFAPASQRLRSRLVFLDLQNGSLEYVPGELPGGFTSMSGRWLADSKCFVYINTGKLVKTCMEGGLLDSKNINTAVNVERLIEVGDHQIPDLIGVAQGAGGRSQLVGIDGRIGTVSTLASSERYTFLDLVTGRAGRDSKRDTMRLVLARDNSTQEAVVLQVAGANKLDEVFRSKAAFSSTRARWAKEGQVFYALLESPTTPSDIWRIDVSGAHPLNLSILNDSFSDVSFAEPIWLRTSPHGKSAGVLLVPNQWHPGVRCPLIVRPYGNQKTSHLLYRFGVNGAGVENLQLLASRGYSILIPTLPLEPGAPLKSIREHVESLVGAAVSQGIADPNRLGVFGHSFGGYAAIGLATGSSPVFRSTVVTGPVGLDLFSYYGFMDEMSASFFVGWTEEGQSNVGANPWSDPSRLLLNSPLFQVDRIHGPVLIMVGESDSPRVPQSNELYVALRRLGGEAEYRIYQREPHWPGSWSAQNAGDYLNRVLSWFDTTLGNAANDAGNADQHFSSLCR